MGHVEPDGTAAEPVAVASTVQPENAAARPRSGRRKRPDPLADRPLWVLWREITGLYPLSQSLMVMITHRSALNRETSWFWFDVVTALRSIPSSVKVSVRLQAVPDADLDGLITIAELNSKRQEHFLRSIVLGYLTVPLTVGAIAAELWPGVLLSWFQKPELSSVWGGTIAGLATALAIRFIADWRARSFLTLLNMIRAERRAEQGRAD